jgi:uncharacterized protein
MRVTELYIYPIKGTAAVRAAAWRLDAFGLQHDRRWMVIDSGGRFVTQRDHPALALLGTAVEDESLVLRSARGGVVRLPLRPESGELLRVSVWGDPVDAVDTGDAAASLLEAHLGFAARLVHMPDTTLRQVDTDYGRAGDRVSFADGFPLLLITQESLDAVNGRLEEPIPMLRFRPNIVVAGAAPHAEDAWRRIRVGTVACDVVKGCARCVVTTIDPATATAGREPLRTLATYRRWDGKVWFGQNVIHRGTGTIRVGDAVTVLEAGEPHPPIERPAAGP